MGGEPWIDAGHRGVLVFRETWEAAEPKALAESVDQQRVVPEASIAGTLENAFRHCHKWAICLQSNT